MRESARPRFIGMLVAQGLDDIEDGRLDVEGAMRLVAGIAWNESRRLPVPEHAVLGQGTSGGPTAPASPSSSASGSGSVSAATETDHKATAVGALVVQALHELDARRLTIVGALERVATSAWDHAASAPGDL